jgi:hypothetical protein
MVEFRSAELPVGSRAEVIVLVEQAESARSPADDAATRLALLDQIQGQLTLTPEAADAWLNQVRDEREAATARVLGREE